MTLRPIGRKVGRNEPCPCGSGKKYKHCHGSPEHLDRLERGVTAAHAQIPRHQAEERQRIAQQGLGRPVISTEFKEHRLVAVGNRLFFSRTAKTFADFLVEYLGTVIHREWGNAELAKSEADMHSVALWYRKTVLHRQKYAGTPGELYSAPSIGASRALLELSYNLYLLEHNAELRDRLIERLKHPDQFLGALSEIRVAGMFVRAGYKIEFEDEDDGGRTHCEYTVTRQETGRQFSVEVKTRHWVVFPEDDDRGRALVRRHVARLARNALGKQADHDRIVFVELAMPHRGPMDAGAWWMAAAEAGVAAADQTLAQLGTEPPSAIAVVSNHPQHLQLDAENLGVGFLLTGTGASEFKGKKVGTLREAVEFQRRNADFLALWESIQKHREIPTTFDGSNPHLAFGEHPQRFLIGERMAVPGDDGATIEAVLEDAVAMPTQRSLTGIFRSDDGKRFIVQAAMTEAELQAYVEHPDTFFGVIKPQRNPKDPLEWFNFFFEIHGKQSKELLLTACANARATDLEQLEKLSQEELATTYCERMVNAMMTMSNARSTAPKN
jgi:hypothetical protein